MATPSLPTINAFNVLAGTTITYQANNGYQDISKSVVTVYDAAGTEIGWHTYTGTSSEQMSTTHILSAKTVTYDATTGIGWEWNTAGGKSADDFVNNTQYQMSILWYDTASTPLPSNNSNYIGFWTLPQPSIAIQIPSQSISVTSYTVTAVYNINSANINNAPSATQFYLYERESTIAPITGTLKEQSPVLYTSGTNGGDGTYQLSYQFTNLENGKTYWIEVETVSTQGMVATDGENKDKLITPTISIEELNVLTVESNNCEGCVNVIGKINNITGIYDDDPTIDPSQTTPPKLTTTGLDLTNTTVGTTTTSHNVTFDDGLQFSANWNLSFWANSFDYATNTTLGSDQYLLHLSNYETLENGIIDIYMVEVSNTTQKAIMIVYPLGYDAGISSYYESNTVTKPTAASNEYTCIQVQYADFTYYININAPQVISPRT